MIVQSESVERASRTLSAPIAGLARISKMLNKDRLDQRRPALQPEA